MSLDVQVRAILLGHCPTPSLSKGLYSSSHSLFRFRLGFFVKFDTLLKWSLTAFRTSSFSIKRISFPLLSLIIHLSNVIVLFSLSNRLSIILLCSSIMYSQRFSAHSFIC